MDILTQTVGVAAMIFSVFSFQMNTHKRIMIMQIITSVLFALQYFLLGAFTGMALNMLAVVRNIVFYNKGKMKENSSLAITVIFAVLMGIVGAASWQGIYSACIIVGMVLNTISLSFTRPKLVRRAILFSSPLMLIYNIITGSWGGIINEIFVEISSVIGFIRYDRKKSE